MDLFAAISGWWGDNPPYHTPVFVLTHHARDPIQMESGTVFHFVTEGSAVFHYPRTMQSLASAALLLCTANCLACDCATSSLADRVKWSNDVYLGEVVRHTPLQSVELKVLERFKGASPERITVVTGRSECDYFLRPVDAQPGDKFLIFMGTNPAGNTVNRCLGSAPAAAATHELEMLRNRAYK